MANSEMHKKSDFAFASAYLQRVRTYSSAQTADLVSQQGYTDVSFLTLDSFLSKKLVGIRTVHAAFEQ